MANPKSPVDRLLDVVVYAPLGLVMNLDEILPQLVEKGHQQVSMARMFGRFAVQTGSNEARKRVEQVTGQVGDLANRHAGSADPEQAATPVTPAGARSAPPPVEASAAPDAGSLAITDYDALSASQVVPRLAGMGAAELESVRIYETANRGRKTILAKITQLQG